MLLLDYETYSLPNWDGDGAEPILPETLRLARAIAALLQKPPDDAPSADGTVGFEWVNGRHKIFMDVGPNHITIYARIDDKTLQVRR